MVTTTVGKGCPDMLRGRTCLAEQLLEAGDISPDRDWRCHSRAVNPRERRAGRKPSSPSVLAVFVVQPS